MVPFRLITVYRDRLVTLISIMGVSQSFSSLIKDKGSLSNLHGFHELYTFTPRPLGFCTLTPSQLHVGAYSWALPFGTQN